VRRKIFLLPKEVAWTFIDANFLPTMMEWPCNFPRIMISLLGTIRWGGFINPTPFIMDSIKYEIA
jgi:hypothetical protein